MTREIERIYYYPNGAQFRIAEPVIEHNMIGQETNAVWSEKKKYIMTPGWISVGITYAEPEPVAESPKTSWDDLPVYEEED